MPTFNANGIELYYEEQGEGAPLILLHGLGANRAMFKREMEHWGASYRVIGLDSRGHGRSNKPAEFTLNDHIEDTVALLDHLGIQKAHVLGVSMGSYIAQGIALAHPERMEKTGARRLQSARQNIFHPGNDRAARGGIGRRRRTAISRHPVQVHVP